MSKRRRVERSDRSLLNHDLSIVLPHIISMIGVSSDMGRLSRVCRTFNRICAPLVAQRHVLCVLGNITRFIVPRSNYFDPATLSWTDINQQSSLRRSLPLRIDEKVHLILTRSLPLLVDEQLHLLSSSGVQIIQEGAIQNDQCHWEAPDNMISGVMLLLHRVYIVTTKHLIIYDLEMTHIITELDLMVDEEVEPISAALYGDVIIIMSWSTHQLGHRRVNFTTFTPSTSQWGVLPAPQLAFFKGYCRPQLCVLGSTLIVGGGLASARTLSHQVTSLINGTWHSLPLLPKEKFSGSVGYRMFVLNSDLYAAHSNMYDATPTVILHYDRTSTSRQWRVVWSEADAKCPSLNISTQAQFIAVPLSLVQAVPAVISRPPSSPPAIILPPEHISSEAPLSGVLRVHYDAILDYLGTSPDLSRVARVCSHCNAISKPRLTNRQVVLLSGNRRRFSDSWSEMKVYDLVRQSWHVLDRDHPGSAAGALTNGRLIHPITVTPDNAHLLVVDKYQRVLEFGDGHFRAHSFTRTVDAFCRTSNHLFVATFARYDETTMLLSVADDELRLRAIKPPSTPLPSLNVACAVVRVAGRECVGLFGGELHDRIASPACWAYDHVDDVWTALPPLPVPVTALSAVNWRGSVIVADGSTNAKRRSRNSSLFVLEPNAIAWRTDLIPRLHTKRKDQTKLAVVSDNLLLICDGSVFGGDRPAEIYMLDCNMRSWKMLWSEAFEPSVQGTIFSRTEVIGVPMQLVSRHIHN